MVFDSGAMLGSILFLVASEPQSLLAFAVLAFAAGMYPVGMFMGAPCFPCCGTPPPPCDQCVQGSLPTTITVSFSGLDDCCYGNRSFVLSRLSADFGGYIPEFVSFSDCVYGRPLCSVGIFGANRIVVLYNGPESPPTAQIISQSGDCEASWTAEQNISDCSQFGFEATNEDGQTITVTAGGNYAAWKELPLTATVSLSGFADTAGEYKTCCGEYYNGEDIAVERQDTQESCSFTHNFCGVGNLQNDTGSLTVYYGGPTQPPGVALVSEISGSGMCNASMEAGEIVCGDDFSFTATNIDGRTATVASGGQYDSEYRNPGPNALGACHICCRGESEPPAEIEVEIEDRRVITGLLVAFSGNPSNDVSGTYMFEHVGGLGYEFGLVRSGLMASFRLAVVAVGDGSLQPTVFNSPDPPGSQQPEYWRQAILPQDYIDLNGTTTNFGDFCEEECYHKCLLEFSAVIQPDNHELFRFSMCADSIETPLCGLPQGTFQTNRQLVRDGGNKLYEETGAIRVTING